MPNRLADRAPRAASSWRADGDPKREIEATATGRSQVQNQPFALRYRWRQTARANRRNGELGGCTRRTIIMNDKLKFAEVYRGLADDELARLALSNQLVPEAQEALTVELEKRRITDLSEYKHTLEEAAGTSSLRRELELEARLKSPSRDGVLVFAAWVLAILLPLQFLSVTPPRSPALIWLCLVGGVYIAFSCYRGLKAWRDGSRKGFVLKFVFPLTFLGISTVFLFVSKLLGLL